MQYVNFFFKTKKKHLELYFFQIRTKSPHRKCAIRYDKLYIDNVPYIYDDAQATVVRYYAPEPLRSGSRTNYSSLGKFESVKYNFFKKDDCFLSFLFLIITYK